MRKYMFLLAALALFSCAKEQNIPEEEQPIQEEVVPQEPETTLKHLTFTGITDDGLTKTTLGTGYSIVWSTEDDITVFPGASADGVKFDCTETNRGGLEATFSGYATASDTYYALSPAQDGATIADGKITATLPTTQTAVAGSYAPEANISVATADNTVFQFKNVGALVGVTIGDDERNEGITGIKLEALGGEQLCGSVTIDPATGDITSRNDPGKNYVQLIGEFTKGLTYYFIILPNNYSNGFRITLDKGLQYTSFTKSFAQEVNGKKGIGRNDNFDFGTVHSNKWKTPFDVGDNLEIINSAESGSDPYYFSYVGSEGYWNSDIQYNDVASYMDHPEKTPNPAYNYEIFTRLAKDEKFYFHAEGGENFTLNAAGTAVERLTKIADAPYAVTASGIYRIRLHMPDGAADIKQIKQVKYDLWGLDSRIYTYKGRGVWSSDEFLMRTDNDSNGYRFLVTFIDDSKQYYGRMSSETGNPTYGTTPDTYFYMQPSTDQNENHWALSFKYQNDYVVIDSRYYCTMTLSFNNDNGHYTHKVDNIHLPNLGTNENLYVGGTGALESDRKFGYNADFDGTSGYYDVTALSAPEGYDYEIFVSLGSGNPVYFYTSNGHLFTFNSDKNGLEKIEYRSDATNCAWGDDGQYRIRIKSSDLSASIFKVNAVEFYRVWTETIEGSLTYASNGEWEVIDKTLYWQSVDWENDHRKDTRYKFKITFADESTEAVQFYGCHGATPGNTPEYDYNYGEDSKASYYYIQPVNNSNKWDHAFKIPYSITEEKTSGVDKANIHLNLNYTDSRSVYNHTWSAE